MVVYQALSSYQILECIEHRNIYHAEEKAVLILGTYIVEKYPKYNLIEELKLFDKVYLFEFGSLSGTEESIFATVDQRIKSTFDFSISEIDKMYIAGIHTYLAAYLTANRIKFSMFEDGTGALSRPWVLAGITKKSAPQKYDQINKFGLYDHTAENIVEKWCNFAAQLEGFKDDKMKHFDVVEAFEKVSVDVQKGILKFFGVENGIDVDDDGVLVLTQQFSNLGQLSFEEHILIYQHMFDFYLDNETNIILKLHPDDIMYYEKLFDNIHVIRNMFPAELLPFVFSNIPKKSVTISSTSTNLIRNKFNECVEFNELYEKSFKFDYTYYTVATLLQEMCVSKIVSIGVNQIQLKNIWNASGNHNIEVCFETEDAFQADVLLIDDFCDELDVVNKENLVKNFDVIIYLNSLKKYAMNLGKTHFCIDEMYPVCVKLEKNPAGEDCVCEDAEYVIWFKTNNERWISMIKKYKKDKKLHNTQATLTIQGYDENTIELMRVKGLLEATERRLLDYINREKELKAEIELLKEGRN